MNQELEFARVLEEIRKLAAKQGNVLSKEQVEEAFGAIGMSAEELDPIYEYLKQKKIGIGEAVDLDSYLTKEDVDYLSLYLSELEQLPQRNDGEKEAAFLSAMAGEKVPKQK